MSQAEEANTIMIGGKTLVVTFQEEPYFSNDSHNLVLKMKCDEYRNKYVQLFLVTVLQADLGRIYSWGDSISSRSIQKDKIALPSTPQNKPDFAYMETYMRNTEPTAQATLLQLMSATNVVKDPLDTSKWGIFRIGELFDIVKGSRLTKADMHEGSIRYVGASSFNNGITTYISNDEHLHPANTLTVCYNGSDIGRTFYQTDPYWATDDVNVLYDQLTEARTQKAVDVLEAIIHSQLIPIPPKVDGWYRLYKDAPETMYASEATIQQFLQLDYAQFIAVRDFLYPDAQFSTEHGVKGEEYDNVVFVISKGWNQYQFETYAPMITGHASIPKGKEASYERNRNLFYVCCSRPKKRLFFFVTVPIDSTFRTFLITLVGEENILTYRQFMEMSN